MKARLNVNAPAYGLLRQRIGGTRRFPVDIRLIVNRGAGYIGGWTAYLSIDCHAPTWPDGYVIRRLQFGVTRNANRTPTYPYSCVTTHTKSFDFAFTRG